jgi:hypothetical protein
VAPGPRHETGKRRAVLTGAAVDDALVADLVAWLAARA